MRRKLKLAITALVLVFSLNLMQPVSAAIEDGTQITEILQPVSDLKAVSLDYGKIKVSWTASEGAEGYVVYRRTGTEEAMSYFTMLSDTEITDDTPVTGSYTYYRVYPYIMDADGEMVMGPSETYVYAKAVYKPAPVQNLKAQLSGPTQVKLTWDPSGEADGYLVYRKAEGEEAFSYRYMVEDPGFIDSTAKRDVYNFYRIYPYILDDSGTMVVGGSVSYVYAKPVSGPEPVQNLKASLSYSNQVQLRWEESKDAEGYLIYRKTEYEDQFSYLYMVDKNSFTDLNPSQGIYNFYRIYPYFTDSEGNMCTGASETYVYARPLGFPTVYNLEAENDSWSGNLNLSWNIDSDMADGHYLDGYLIYRKIGSSGEFKYRAISDYSFFEDDTASYTDYNFYVVYPFYYKEDGSMQLGPCESYTYGKAKVPPVGDLFAYEQIDQIRLQWRANSQGKADGYDIYRQQGSGSFTYLTSTTGTEYIDKNASKTEANYYRVYPYRTINGQHVLGMSNTYVYGWPQNYSLGQAIADYGWQFIGTPYVYGGNSLTTGVDCSGFTTQVHKHFGIDLPRTSQTQESAGKDIGRDLENAKPGDVICYCYDLSEPSCHVAIYVGRGRIIHSTTREYADGTVVDGIQIGYADYMTIKTIRRFW